MVLSVLLAVSACKGVPTQPEAGLQEATAEQLTALLRARAEATRSAKGLFRAHIKGPGLILPARVNGTVFYSKPDAFRVRGFSLFGGELFELVINRDAYRLVLPTEGRELKGDASELGRVAKFGRPVQLSLWAVHGALGLTTIGEEDVVSLGEDGDRYRLEVRGPAEHGIEGTLRRLWFDRRTLLMVQEEWLGSGGEVEAVMRYEDYRSVPEAILSSEPPPLATLLRPYRIVMEDGRGRGSVQLTFQEIVPNVPVRPDELGVI
ncbi:hypothetical protein YTPLAS18_14350 [Nitrospira sp.]|nr:hypothetical protein YTPLAS18_14350 [Nitrospira sp.]